MTHKILVIPSWYPTIDSPAVGSFCREQTELVSDRYDIRVIYPRLQLVGKKTTLKKLGRTNTSIVKKTLLGSTPGVELEVTVSSFLSAGGQQDFLSGACEALVRSWEAGGWRPAMIHAHGTLPAGLLAEFMGKRLGIPYLITEHHSLLVANFDPARWAAYKRVQEGSDGLMVVSNELKKMILMNGVVSHIAVVGNLLDEELFTIAERGKAGSGFHILFMAVPARTKDIPTFIRSLRGVKAAGYTDLRATLVIPDVAADLSRQEIMDLCKEHGVSEYCQIMGSVAHDRIPALLHSCDVLVSTSITETFGLSVAEAIMCGKPVVATRSGGVEDFVGPENGILVNIGDDKTISNVLMQLIRGEIRFDADAARAAMVERFGKEAFRARICEIYNKSING